MKTPIRIGIVGLGKISQAQHLPVIDSLEDFQVAFLADRAVRLDRDEPWFDSLDSVLASGVQFDAVALCTSPQPRLELCEALFETGCSILLEKPAAASFQEAKAIERMAIAKQVSLMTGWHSQFAPAVSAAKEWLSRQTLVSGSIAWRENANKWHPGQDWLWRSGGYGVFDPGMNALSILSSLISIDWRVENAVLQIPKNVETATRANFILHSSSARIDVEFEFHDEDEETWQIALQTRNGDEMIIAQGGEIATVNTSPLEVSPSREYETLYRRFSSLSRKKKSLIDLRPLDLIEQIQNSARIIETAEIDVVTTPQTRTIS